MPEVARRLVRSPRGAAAFVNRAGIALAFPSDELVLPSLWEAAVGDREVDVFVVDERGKRVLTPELRLVWTLKNRLAEERTACVGKHVAGRVALISLDALPALYALTGRSGRSDDFRSSEELSAAEAELAEALLELGPQTAPDLRRLVGSFDARTTKRALERLQRLLVATQAGEAEQEHGWDAAVFDLVARRYEEAVRRLPARDEARRELVERLLRSAGELSAADTAAVLGISRRDAAATLDRLADERRCTRHDREGFALWKARGR
jgi:hypothetical protein